MFSKNIQEEISLAVITVLLTRFESFPNDSTHNRNAPFHEAFLNAFSDKLEEKTPSIPYLISLSSWLHGLSTSLGQSFFEKVAHILSGGEKRSFTHKQKTLLPITKRQKEIVGEIITNLANQVEKPSLVREYALLERGNIKSETVASKEFTADVFYEDSDEIVAIELKTVKPNAGIMQGEKQKILEAKSALLIKYPNKKINYYMGFPFDPNSSTPTSYDKRAFLQTIVGGEKYIDLDEVLLSAELWEFLSGENDAMEQILNVINRVAKPDFMDNYIFLNTPENRRNNAAKYRQLLQHWYLFSELKLLDNDNEIALHAKGHDKRAHHSSIFDATGKYKWDRYRRLSKLFAPKEGD